MCEKNLYQILQININANSDEINKSYRKLALKYHPDKCQDESLKDSYTAKFRDIQFAYEILKDTEKRQHYDKLNLNDQMNYYNSFIEIFSLFPNYTNIISKVIQIFYSNNNDFKNDISNLNFINIKDRIINKINHIDVLDFVDNISCLINNKDSLIQKLLNVNKNNNTDLLIPTNNTEINTNINEQNKLIDSEYDESETKITVYENKSKSPFEITESNTIDNCQKENKDLDIFGEFMVTLKEIYNKKLKELTVSQDRLCEDNSHIISQLKKLYIPLNEKLLIFRGEGDQDPITKKIGNLIIKIKHQKHDQFVGLNDYDLLIDQNISLYEYIYGFELSFLHLDGNVIKIQCDTPIYSLHHVNGKQLYIIKDKGLPKSMKSDERGDLYININIKVPNDCKKILYTYFPPINGG